MVCMVFSLVLQKIQELSRVLRFFKEFDSTAVHYICSCSKKGVEAVKWGNTCQK